MKWLLLIIAFTLPLSAQFPEEYDFDSFNPLECDSIIIEENYHNYGDEEPLFESIKKTFKKDGKVVFEEQLKVPYFGSELKPVYQEAFLYNDQNNVKVEYNQHYYKGEKSDKITRIMQLNENGDPISYSNNYLGKIYIGSCNYKYDDRGRITERVFEDINPDRGDTSFFKTNYFYMKKGENRKIEDSTNLNLFILDDNNNIIYSERIAAKSKNPVSNQKFYYYSNNNLDSILYTVDRYTHSEKVKEEYLYNPNHSLRQKDIYVMKYGDWRLQDRTIYRREAISNVYKEDINNSKAYPNPAGEIVTIEYNVKEPSNVIIEIVDINGKVVKTINLGHQNSGYNQKDIYLTGINQGTYTYIIRTETQTMTGKIIVSK